MSETEKRRPWPVLDWLSTRLNLTEIFSLLTSFGLFHAEVDASKGLRRALAEAHSRPLPSYSRWPRVLGLVVVVLIGLEIVTGVLLALYYLPTPESAHASLGTVLRSVDFGWFIHQLHFWGAQLLVAVLIVRVVRFFVQGVYRAPRELVWVFGALLLLVCLHADLTGRLLPFTDQAYWSVVRAIEVVAAVPIYGSIVVFLIGGSKVLISDLTLIRFYMMHVAVLPILAVTLIYLHFSSVRRVGLSGPEPDRAEPSRHPLRLHLIQLGMLLTVLFGLLVTLSVLDPLPFQPAADPYTTVPGVGPPWYLLAPFGFLEWSSQWIPRWTAGSLLFIAFSAFVVLPFWDRPRAGARRPWWVLVIAGVAAILWVAFTLHGARVA